MSRISVILLFACMLTYTHAHAQGGLRLTKLANLVQHNTQTAARTHLSPNTVALSNFLKQLKTDPTTAYYTPQIRQMQDLGLLSGPLPPLSNPEYLKTLEKQVLAAQRRAELETGHLLDATPVFAAFTAAPEALMREALKNPVREINMAASADGYFSWGFEGLNRVSVTPYKLLRSDLEDYVLRAVKADPYFDPFTAYKRIIGRVQSRHLSAENALQAILYLNGAAELLDYQFVKTYVRRFNALPRAEGYDTVRYADLTQLRRFAMQEGVKRVSDASAGEKLYNADHLLREFTVYSAFLDPRLSDALALALQTKRYKHGLWLLQNPDPDQPEFQKVRSFLQNWKNGSREQLNVKITPPADLAAAKEARRTLLSNRRAAAEKTLHNIQRNFLALKKSNPPPSLLTRAEIDANTRVLRLTKLTQRITQDIIRLNAEIASLRAQIQPKEPVKRRQSDEETLRKYFK